MITTTTARPLPRLKQRYRDEIASALRAQLELGNAMLLSSLLGRPLELPLDAQAYADKLQELIAISRFQKVVRQQEITDLDDSF